MTVNFVKTTESFSRIFAIPDTHGEFQKFNSAVNFLKDDLKFSNRDLLVLLGDYCDRNQGTIDIIAKIREIKEEFPNSVVALRGNHEAFAHSVIEDRTKLKLWLINGGGEMLKGYGWCGEVKRLKVNSGGFLYHEVYFTEKESMDEILSSKNFKNDTDFLMSLPLALETNEFFFSHAPVPRESKRRGPKSKNNYGYKGRCYNEWELTWHNFGPECEREGAYMFKHEGPKSDLGEGTKNLHGVCGHLHRISEGNMNLREFPNYTLLDAGCGCHPDAPLVLYECITRKFWKF